MVIADKGAQGQQLYVALQVGLMLHEAPADSSGHGSGIVTLSKTF
jgi:hypothetical protein